MSQIQQIKFDPDTLDSIYWRAYSLIQTQKYDEAIECLKPVIEEQLDNFHAQYNTAYCLRKLKRYRESLDHFNEILKYDPKNHHAKNNIEYIKKVYLEDGKNE